MSAPGKSLAAIGFGLFMLGLALLLFPAPVLTILGFEVAGEPWVRVLGLVVAALGSYYMVAGRAEHMQLIRASVPVRIAAGVGFAVLVVVGVAPLPLLIFTGLEFVGAAWTFIALRGADARSTASSGNA